ncbi:MAG: hypothetical protein H6R40_1434 [Gemmatimonadetes bacterium]|nr:hypothetical protein [Gemmatimonadota bacterium]
MPHRLVPARLVLIVAAAAIGPRPGLMAQQVPENADSTLARLVRDYTGLYQNHTFVRWQELFRPAFTSTATNLDGTVTVRSLEEFLEAQRVGFQRAREMREELENVRVERRGRLATVWADFIFHYDGKASRGKLVLLCVADQIGWKIQSLAFGYDP